MSQLLIEYGTLWVMVSAGMACLVIAVGAWGKADVPVLSTAAMAFAAATLWPLFTALLVGFFLVALVFVAVMGVLLLPPNIILAVRGMPLVKPFASQPKEEAKT